MRLFGYEIGRYEHLTAYNGLPTHKKLEMLSAEKGLPHSLHTLIWQLKQKYTTEQIFKNCTPSFEKEYMVRRLKQEGYRLAVCSNSIHTSVAMMLRGIGLIDQFEFFLSNEDVRKPKPDAEIFLKAFAQMNLKPDQCLIVEDAGPGIKAAERSGAHVCRVSGFEDVNHECIKNFIQTIKAKKQC